MRAILREGLAGRAWARAGMNLRPSMRWMALTLAFAASFGACVAAEANALTLRLVFPDGQPMTYGSACAGVGCLQRDDHVRTTNGRGEIDLPGGARAIEYRRDGVHLGLAPPGHASGSIVAVGDRATIVLPRMLVGSDPTVDATESDLVARLNEARAAQGLELAQINPNLSTAADLQATWLMQTGVSFSEPSRFHVGPFESDLAFRHGEVSLPDPDGGGEIAEAGGTIDETIADWLSSAQHREQILAPGKPLIGAAKVGTFTIVQTHKRCAGCVQAGTGTRASAPAPAPFQPAPAPAPPAPPVVAAAPTIGSSQVDAPPPSCGREQLATRRLQNHGRQVRLRIGTGCLRPGARYTLLVRQGTSGRVLRTVRISRAGTLTLQLRPSRTTSRLRIKLKRDGRAVVIRTMSLRT